MIRVTVLSILVAFLAVYAWRDWFKSLCGLVLLVSVLEHPDMPKQVFGIPGLNLWNILFLSIVLAWIEAIKKEGLVWDMPRPIGKLLVLYAAIIVLGVLRLLIDHTGVINYASLRGIPPPSLFGYINDDLINAFKFTMPGLLLFYGCRTKSRLYWAAGAIIAMYTILAILTIKTVKFDVFTMTGDELQSRAHKVLPDNVGFHRVNLSMMFSGAVWAVLAFRELFEDRKIRLGLAGLSVLVFLAMASTGGRMGYLTCGLLMCALIVIRWRKLVFMIPVLAIVVLTFMPSVVERMSFGFSPAQDDAAPSHVMDEELGLYQMTSGRILAWPLVIEKIRGAPILGYGREAMINTGITAETFIRFGQYDTFAHPHNGYLQWVLDNGFIGLLIVALFYFYILRYSIQLLRDPSDPVFTAVGGMALCLVGALLVASLGSQSFYPREGSVGMWCAIGLMLRVYVQREKLGKTREAA